jgi:hypothetical protein
MEKDRKDSSRRLFSPFGLFVPFVLSLLLTHFETCRRHALTDAAFLKKSLLLALNLSFQQVDGFFAFKSSVTTAPQTAQAPAAPALQ